MRVNLRHIGFMALASLVALLSVGVANAQTPTLADIEAFEVVHFHENYGPEKRFVRPEIYGYLENALGHDTRLKRQSPADGKIYLSCGGPQCVRVVITVRHGGPDGPVVYKKGTANYFLYYFTRFWSVERRAQTLSKRLVKHLGDAYEDAKAGY